MGLEMEESFLQREDHMPSKGGWSAGTQAEGIPLIDLSPASDTPGSEDHTALVRTIGMACEEWGFFQVVNHGVPPEARRRAESVAVKFFALLLEEKRMVARDEERPLGYHEGEHTKNVRDWKEVYDFLLHEPVVIPATHVPGDSRLQAIRNQWPEAYRSPGFREVCEVYGLEMEKFAFKLLGLISLSLGLPATRLNSYFEEQTSFTRFNHYPPCPTPHLALGVGRHKDSGALTILAQDDVGGLQVKRKADGQWVNVMPVPDSYVINVGDIIQVWSNDKYESVEHRVVVNSERERFSIPFFFFPAHHVMVKPLEEMVNEQNPPKYKEFNWGKFFMTRKLSDFKRLDVENIQIDDFKISVEHRASLYDGLMNRSAPS